ncbi:MAG: PVC-type heme-binding CxxCH protein [Verrucomicrobiota bacterium]
MNVILRLFFVGLILTFGAGLARAEFDFEKGDRVVLIGNALAERMQHHGWLEALVQGQEKGKKLVFRNQGFSGDQVKNRPRSKGFLTAEDYLTQSKADVIFVFFGYNESFMGEAGVGSFKADLGEMVDAYRELKPNGEDEPRIVLFSPIAHEDLRDRNLPDGKKNNERLALYAAAIKDVAADKETGFVDLFEPSKVRYAASEAPLTINGIHLTEEGNRQLAEEIGKQLYGEKIPADERLQALRSAVLDKNWHWFNRYRATDGNDVWGTRSTLTFVNDQSNAEVLQHELEMLDVMTANRDQRIWAVARGKDLKVDDGNVPEPVPVISNVGGGSKSSNAEKEGSLEYQSGEEGLETITVPEGYEVNLFADEAMFPELVNPVQMQVDGQGRLWVAAWKTYPKWEPMKEMNDRLLILPDEDGDGVADRAITFAKVHNPLGFEFWNGGVLVTRGPDLLFLRDTDGDDVADEEIVMVHGLGTSDTHHAANNLIYGPDGAIYWQSGIFLHNNIEHPWGPSLNTGASGMYRFDPRQFTISYHADNRPNPHGTSFDYWGYQYANNGTGGHAYQVRPEGDGFKMHLLATKEVRPVPANEIVSSANFPDDVQGNFLICNAIGFLGLKQYELNRDGGSVQTVTTGKGEKKKTTTTTTKLGEVWGEPVEDMLVSSDKNFRPADAIFGEDGALYVADWHNVIIGHMQHNIRDPNRDDKHGRIYRVVYQDKPLQEPAEIEGASLEQLMKNLEHPVDGVRHRTRVELSERDTTDVIAAVEKWLKQFDPKSKEDAHHFLEALWLHQQHNVKNQKLLNIVLRSPEPHAQIAGQTVQHHLYVVDHRSGGEGPTSEDLLHGSTLPSGIIANTPELTEVRIGTIVEQMRFDLKEFEVPTGKKLKIHFHNPDFLPHNVVFVNPNKADEVAMAALQLGEKGFEVDFLPESDEIIAATSMLDNGEEEILEFTAPEKAGDYEFVCTFPGHHIAMRGVMKVIR